MTERIIPINDIQICTESFGNISDPAILLLTGATVSMLYWDSEFCTKLAEKGYFVIRYDNRDVGKSTFYEAGSTPYDIVDLSHDAIQILDYYQIDKAHLVGMSLGGLVAQIASIQYPHKLHSLTLFATGPWGIADVDIPEMDTQILEFHRKSSSINWNDENAVVDYMMEGAKLMTGSKPFYHDRAEKLIRDEFRRANNYISMFNHTALQGGEEYWDRINEIKLPTLIIHGTADIIWHYKNAEVLLRKIENAKLLTLEGTGHELHYEDWNTVIEGIDHHIKSI